MHDDAGRAPQQPTVDGEQRGRAAPVEPPASRPGSRQIVTPQGTMVVVLLYALGTVLLWSYVYYYTLRFGGVIGGH